jgi:hypothetical protein
VQTAYIRFLTQENRLRGYYELATRARIGSLLGEVYQIPIEALTKLEAQHIAYRRAPDAEVRAPQVRVIPAKSTHSNQNRA